MDEIVPRDGVAPDADADPRAPDGPETVLVWHPAIVAIGWIISWLVFASLLAVAWQPLAEDGLGRASAGPIVARACGIAVAIPLLFVVVLVGEFWWMLVQHERRLYGRRPPYASRVARLTGITLAILAIYGLMVWLLYHWLWPHLERLGQSLPGTRDAPIPWNVPTWVAAIILGLVLWRAWKSISLVARKYARAWRLYGTRPLLKGMAVMFLLRGRQPRKDFFFQMPIIGQVWMFVVAAVLSAVLPGPFFSRAVPLVVVFVAIGRAFDYVLPPSWLFLGRSRFDSFLTFDLLRENWRIFGVTLLNRDSLEWARYYFAFRDFLIRRGVPWVGLFMNNPRTPRVWSLRTRPGLWEHTIWLLMAHTKVIVIDVRADTKSYYIFDEVLWLAELKLIEKTWYLGNADGSAPAIDGALEWGVKEGVNLDEPTIARIRSRIVTEDRLCEAEWTNAGPNLKALA